MPEVVINELSEKDNSTPVSLVNNGNGNGSSARVMIVDSHEPIDIAEKLRQKGIPVKVETLSSGDYIFSNIGVERKTLSDFWGSITSKDKRIWRQMFALKRNFEKPFLVIETFNMASLRSPSYSNQIWGAIVSIALMGISVITITSVTGGSREFVDFMNYLYFSADKTKKTSKPLPKKSSNPKEVFRDTLCMVPQIGPVTAKKLMARFRSWEELCEASKEDLSGLCGRTKYKMLWRILHGENP